MNGGQAAAREPSPGEVIRRVGRLALASGEGGVWWRLAVSLASLSLAKIGAVCMPLAYGALVDHLSGDRLDATVFLWLLGGYALARLGHELATEVNQVVFARVAQRAVKGLSLAAFARLHALPLDFHLDRRTGDLAKAMDRGARGVDQLLSLTMYEIVPVGLELALASGVLWAGFGLDYAALTLGTVAGYTVFTVVCTEWRVRFRRRQNAAEEAAMGHAVDSLLNYETIKYCNAEARVEARQRRLLTACEEAAVRWRTSVAVVNCGQGAIITLGLLAVMALSGHDIAAGRLRVGQFVAVNAYLLQLYLPLGFLGHVYREVRSALTDIGRLFALMDRPGLRAEATGLPELPTGDGSLEFSGVAFAYADRPVLRDVSFRVERGQTVAVVGPSGAGKSTLVRLLLGLYRPEAGVIRVGGTDIATVSPASLRRVVGVVPQEAALFNDTLGYNITLDRPGADAGALARAVGLAMLDDLVGQLPRGLDTPVGERGLKLSGGERQRVAIARAVLTAPAILVLDEATSSLDSRTEQDIQQAIRRASRSRATLVIAHRLSTVADAKTILVLEAGRVVEAGDHAALLARDGLYASLWRRQAVGTAPKADAME